MPVPIELQPDESVTFTSRRHWVFLYPRLALQFLVAVAPPLGLVLLMRRAGSLDGTVGLVTWGLVISWLAATGVRAYLVWYRYRNDVWVITNQRLIDSQRRHWFHHAIASADLVDVQDVAVIREGLLPTMLNYGELRCQTAGEQPNFILGGIPDPTGVLAILDRARDAARRDEGGRR
ncbi:MAG: hypothetical protein Q8M79_02030 [Dehalococcoidia bacterium]|nr:hypothetical protein [Dehalococcoidia bacterium]